MPTCKVLLVDLFEEEVGKDFYVKYSIFYKVNFRFDTWLTLKNGKILVTQIDEQIEAIVTFELSFELLNFGFGMS